MPRSNPCRSSRMSAVPACRAEPATTSGWRRRRGQVHRDAEGRRSVEFRQTDPVIDGVVHLGDDAATLMEALAQMSAITDIREAIVGIGERRVPGVRGPVRPSADSAPGGAHHTGARPPNTVLESPGGADHGGRHRAAVVSSTTIGLGHCRGRHAATDDDARTGRSRGLAPRTAHHVAKAVRRASACWVSASADQGGAGRTDRPGKDGQGREGGEESPEE
jgi:hypothetical protein